MIYTFSYDSNHFHTDSWKIHKNHRDSQQRRMLMHCRDLLWFESYCESRYKCQKVFVWQFSFHLLYRISLTYLEITLSKKKKKKTIEWQTKISHLILSLLISKWNVAIFSIHAVSSYSIINKHWIKCQTKTM